LRAATAMLLWIDPLKLVGQRSSLGLMFAWRPLVDRGLHFGQFRNLFRSRLRNHQDCHISLCTNDLQQLIKEK
jgi:hypothetical protein